MRGIIKMKKTLAASISMLIVLTMVGCGKKAPASTSSANSTPVTKVTLNLSTPDPDSSSITAAAKEYAKVINEKSKGAIDVKVYPNGSLYGADPAAAVKQLGAGSIDMLLLSTSLYANFQPKFNVISIPYLFDNTDQFLKYLNGAPGKELLGDVDKLGIKGLGLWTRSFRQITNSKRSIQTPDDLKGMKLRVPNNPLWVEFFKAAGAVPTPMAFGEVYNALQLKTIDGQENPVDVPMSSKFYEVQKYITVSNHMADAWVLGISKTAFGKLSQDQQKLLADVSNVLQTWKVNYDKEQDTAALKTLESKNMVSNSLTPEQQSKFIEVSKQLYPKFKELVKDDTFFNSTLKFVGKDK
jgi:TRAP-type transport system periplasmic protein